MNSTGIKQGAQKTINVLIYEQRDVPFDKASLTLISIYDFHILGIFHNIKDLFNYLKLSTVVDVIVADINKYDEISHIVGEMGNMITKRVPVVFVIDNELHKNDSTYEEIIEFFPTSSYIVKPFSNHTLSSFIKFQIEIYRKFLNNSLNISNLSSKIPYIRVGNKREVILPCKIEWIASDRNHCTIYMSGKKQYIVKKSLKSLFKVLPNEEHIFIHKSYIVQLASIKRVDLKTQLVYLNDVELPLGRKYIKSIRQHMESLG